MTVAEVGCSNLPGSRPSPVSYLLMNSGPEGWVGHGLWMRLEAANNEYEVIPWTVPPYTNSHHNPDHKKKHKHDGPKMPLRSWVGTFCQSTNPQRSWGFHSMNPIVHKEVGFVYTLTGKGQ